MVETKENSNFLLKTPVLFLIFNRPHTTSVVFKKIRQARPPRLYVASDGPREGNQNDKIKVTESRKIIDKIDWPCEIKTLFRKKNLGCKKAVSTAIDWFFENEEKGIILEDDCVPNLDFFNFCEVLLDRYAHNQRISVISGNNFQNGKWRGDASYYFSKYPHIWGWATWRRAWTEYQANIPFWSKLKNSKEWLKLIPDKKERNYWQKIFKKVQSGRLDSWAYPWVASIWNKEGLTATPNVNLVSNIGFGEDSTHTKKINSLENNISAKELGKIVHPSIIEINVDADIYDFEWTFGGRNLRFPRNLLLLPIKIFNFISKKF
jgi:hypothetical protein